MRVLTSNQTNKHFIIRAFLFIPPSKIEERIYTGQSVPQLLRANSSEKTLEKNINNSIEIQSEVLSQCESCIVYNLSLLIFALYSF